ncbi:hypothetical protein D3C85_795830 [compost metagenome]
MKCDRFDIEKVGCSSDIVGHPHFGQKSGVAAGPAGEFVSVMTDRKWPIVAHRWISASSSLLAIQ